MIMHEIQLRISLLAFGPTHAREVETEVILTAFSNICITGFE